MQLADRPGREDSRRDLMNVAIDCFAKYGYAATSIDRIADENVGKYQVFSVDIDQAPRVATRYGIRAVPTLLAFKNGVPKGQLVGVSSRDAVLKLLA